MRGFLLGGGFLGLAASGESLSWIRSSTVLGDFHFYDELGRRRIFHGSNRVRKSPPWFIPEMAADDDDARAVQSLGAKVIRLGFMWSGYNPAPGSFNQTYIDIIKTTVDRLARHGVYSLLNVQMDGLSSKFCSYDGVPLWVIDKVTPPKFPFPWPLNNSHSDCKNNHGDVDIVTEASATAYQDIFDNTRGILDDFVAFWSHAARQFKDIPGIIGYDLINEPFAGNYFKDPALLLPGVAGRKNLQRFYDTVAAAIREYDQRHIIFYEPTTWGMIFNGTIDGSGFEHVPGGDAYRNRSAYSYHYYCHSFLPGYNEHPVLQKVVCDSSLAHLVYKAVQEDLNRLGGAAMMTEGMQCSGVDSECEDNREALDSRLFSWIDWNYGTDNSSETASRARTYAYAVAGLPLNMSFDTKTKEFDFCFELDPAATAPTEIFASTKYNYQNGFTVRTSGVSVNTTTSGDIVFITPAASSDKKNGRTGVSCVKIYSRTAVAVAAWDKQPPNQFPSV